MTSDIFRCPTCETGLKGWPPSLNCASCGHTIRTDEGVLIFTDEPNLNLDGDRQYVGYDSIANAYAQYLYPEGVERQISIGYGKMIAELVDSGRTILDLGCGHGKFDVEIAKRGHRVVAGDISLNMLKILSGKLKQAPERSIIPCRLNAYSLPLLDRSVDAAMAMSFLHFVGDPPFVIGEIKRVLKPGGIFITHGPGATRSPNDDIVGEINGKIRRYYDEALKRSGVKPLKPPGWTNRQIWENLPKLFRSYSVVERDDLFFRFIETPRWFLQRLGSRYTLFQMGFDQEDHDEAMREVRDRVVSEYGRSFEELEQEYCETHPLSVCRD